VELANNVPRDSVPVPGVNVPSKLSQSVPLTAINSLVVVDVKALTND
jgi:hypothetical protein